MRLRDIKYILKLVAAGLVSLCLAMIPEAIAYGIYCSIAPSTGIDQIILVIVLLSFGMPFFIIFGIIASVLLISLLEAL